MAVSTLDGIVAGWQVPQFFYKGLTGTLVAGRPHSLWYENAGTTGDNIPGAVSVPAPGLAGTTLVSPYAGQIPFPTIASGNRYLGRFVGSASATGGMLQLCDRLWQNSGIVVSVATTQTIGSVTWPARDNNGAITGEGVVIAIEVTTGLGAGTPTYNLKYTNSDGTAGKLSTNVVATAASAIQGAFYPIGLAAGDKGVRSVQEFWNTSSSASGAVAMVAYRVIASIELPLAGTTGVGDPITLGMPRMYADTVPFLLFTPYGTTSSRVIGQVVYIDG